MILDHLDRKAYIFFSSYRTKEIVMQFLVINKSYPLEAKGYKLIADLLYTYGQCLQISICRSTFVLPVGI
jgi:hypothetical protein